MQKLEIVGNAFTATFEDGHKVTVFPDEQNANWRKIVDTFYNGVSPVVVTPQDVNAERGRRVLEGSTFVLSSGKQVKLKGDDTTKTNLQALAFAASLRIAQGARHTVTLFRDETDWVHELTQEEVIELWTKSAAFVSAMFQAAWFLKDGPSIPQDYKDDKYWVFA